MQEDSQLKELELTWAVANTAAVKDLAALGPNREGKITRAGFKAGGGSDADFDRYRNGWKAGSNDGFLDITQLEARAAAQIMAVKDLAAMGPHSDGKVTRAGFKTGGGGHADFDRYDSDKDGMLDLSELEARAAVNTMRGKHDGYYYGTLTLSTHPVAHTMPRTNHALSPCHALILYALLVINHLTHLPLTLC